MNEAEPWRFAVRLWKDRAVERACLRLQDEFSVPVAAVLVALWAASTGRRPDPALGRRLLALAEQFEADYLTPLRAVRRRAAGDQGGAELKRQIQEAELEGERLLLARLGKLAAALPAGDEPASRPGWLLVVMPEAARCEGLQALLNELSENPASSG
jgi:uncharacterized protein (TIGR02444 family)